MKRVIFISALLFITICNHMYGYSFVVNGIYYDILSSGNYVSVTYQTSNYNSYSGVVNIPSSVTYNGTTYSVTTIGNSAFRNSSGLTSVIIPNSITSIGTYAFYGCSKMTSVNLPNSVTSIGANAFYGCSNITQSLYNSTIFAFLPRLYSGSYTIPSGITSIADEAFYGCTSLTRITIPNSVTTIGYRAFYGCTSLASLTISNGVKTIGNYAFYGCSSLTNAIIPNSVTNIGSYAFEYCSGLTSVTLSNSITSIESSLFEGCTSLASVTIPNNVRTIYSHAFRGCTALTNVTMSNSVTTVGCNVFSGCTHLTQPVYNNTIFAYMPTSYNGSYTIPSGITNVACGAFSGCTGLTNVTIPNSVTDIDGADFNNCTSIIQPLYNNSLFVYLPKAYNGSYTVPSGIKTIAANAFSGCTGLTGITIPNSVTSIGNYAFEGCTGLTGIAIPNSVTSIGNYAFERCTGLTTMTIPESVTTIGNFFIMYCSGLTSLYFKRYSPPSNINLVFWNENPVLYVPCGALQSYQSALNSNYTISEWNAFTLSVQSADDQYGTASITQQFSCTQPAIISATATADHYHFARWSDGISSNPRTINTLTSDITYLALFEIDKHTITLNGANGSVSGGGQYDYGTSVTLSATPNPHYHFVRWSDGITTSTRTITVTSNKTYTAIFEPDRHNILASGTNGSVEGSGQYDYGSSATLTATPNLHYHFVRWSDGNTSNPRSITVNGNQSYTAIFEIDKHTITANGTYGSVSGGGQYNYGTSVVLTATANAHYHFARWSDGNTSNPRSVTVNGNQSYTAVFEIDTHTITANGTYGSVTGSGQYNYGTSVVLIATANAHYHFVGWSDGNTSNPRNVTVNSNKTYTALFEIDKHTVIANGTNGSVSGDGQYDYGTSITLTAHPNAHYHFVGWSDGVSTASRNVTVTGDVTYTAFFEIDKHTITVDETVGGLAVGGGLYDYGTTVTLTATAVNHYHFVGWSDGITSSTRTLTVTENKTYTAIFEIDKHTISAHVAIGGIVMGYGQYDYGTSITLTAIEDDHYHFVSWSDGVTSNVRVVSVTEDKTYTAIFEIDKHTITVDGEYGSVTGGGQYDYGAIVTLTAIPNDHYHFVRWSDGVTTSIRKDTVRGDKSYTAVFELDKHVLSTNSEHCIIDSLGMYYYGTTVTLTVLPDDHYHFVKWLDDESTIPVRTVQVTEDKVYDVEIWIDSFDIKVSSQNAEVRGNGRYEFNSIVTLVAIADNGYKFVQWSDGSVYNPYIFEAIADTNLQAICAIETDASIVQQDIPYCYANGVLYNPDGLFMYLYSSDGRLITSSSGDIDMKFLPQGVYFVFADNGTHIKIVHTRQ